MGDMDTIAASTICSTMPMSPMTSLVTSATGSCETSRLHSRQTSPEHCDLADIAIAPFEEQHEVRLPYMRLRTDSGIGMPVWDSSMLLASHLRAVIEPAGDEESAVDTTVIVSPEICCDTWSFGMAVSPVPMMPLVMPAMPPSPAMSAIVSPVMHPPAMLPTMPPSFPPGASPYGDGYAYDVQAYNQAWPSDEGHGVDGQAYNQAPCAPARSRKRASKGHGGRGADASQKSLPTTICFRNLPNNYSTKMVLELLDQNGFKDGYDFIYVPHDFKRLPSLVNVGYFFVNFVNHEIAVSALNKLVGFKNWTMLSTKVLEGTWAAKTQGKNACRERCKYFTFMHEDIPAECKPMMFDRSVAEC